jgi:hypothetical protein
MGSISCQTKRTDSSRCYKHPVLELYNFKQTYNLKDEARANLNCKVAFTKNIV